MKTMAVIVVTVAAVILCCGVMVAPAEGGRALLDLDDVIGALINCPPPPSDNPAPEPYSAPYSESPPAPDVLAPAPGVYQPSPEYQSPPPYAYPSPVVDASPPVCEPSPEYPSPPPAGY